MKTTRLLVLLIASLFCLCKSALAQEDNREAYAVLEYSGNTLTFYYDNNQSTRNGSTYSIPWNTDNPEEEPLWHNQNYRITKVVFDETFGDYLGLTSTANMFYDLYYLTTIEGISYLKTDNVTDMSHMFHGCRSLESLDVSSFNTSSVENMSYMFDGCQGLDEINLSNFITSSVKNMSFMFAYCMQLSELNLSSFNTESVTDMSDMFNGCDILGELDLSTFNTARVTDMSDMFKGCLNLINLVVSGINTARVTDMSEMFDGCAKLNNLNLSSFNTENVTDMSSMFSGCAVLENLDLSNFNPESVTDMSYMFHGCAKLNELNLSNFNTESVTSMSHMFFGCAVLDKLDLSKFNTENVEDMSHMFHGCAVLDKLDLSKFNTENVTNMSDMFHGCATLGELDLSNFSTSAGPSMSSMFESCTELKNVDIRNFSISGEHFTNKMFKNCSILEEILCLNTWNPSGNYYSQEMFSGCTNLKGGKGSVYNPNYINNQYAHPDGGPSNPGYFTEGKPYAILSDGTLTFYYDLEKDDRTGTDFDFPTGNNAPDWTSSEYASSITNVTFDESFLKYTEITSPKSLFNGLSNLATINNLRNLPTANVTDMSYMFSGFSNLTSIDLTNFNTARVTDMSNMFSGCSSLTSLDLSNLNSPKVTDMSNMFYGCNSLESLVLPNFYSEDYNSAHLTNTSHMFDGCSSLTSIDVSKINTEYVTDMSNMFYGCSSLESLDLNNFYIPNATNLSYMFNGCSSLENIYCSYDWAQYGKVTSETSVNMFAGCVKLPNFDSNEVTVAKANPRDGGYFSVPAMAYAYLNNHKLIFRYDDNWIIDPDNAPVLQKDEQYYLGEIFGNDVTQVIFEPSFRAFSPTSTANWFASMRYLESITGLEYLNTEAVTNMNSMFYGCEKLTSLDLTSFDVSKVTDMGTMFAYCSSLEMIYAGNWYDILNGKVYSSGMFAGCEELPNWDESNSNDINYAKPSENGGYFSTRSVYAIVEDGNLSFHYDGKNTDKTTYDIDWTKEESWKDATFTTVTFDPSFADYKLTSTAGMFSGLTGLTTIYGLDNLNTSSITDMSNMFNGCTGLTTIYCGKDWSGLDVTSSDGMFAGCENLVGAISYNENTDTEHKNDIKYANPYDGYFSQLPQAYAVQEGSVLTFYYDNRINTHSDAITYEIPWVAGIEGGDEGSGGGYPGWINFGDEEGGGYAPARKSAKARTANEPITLVVFDPTFKNYHGLNSTANMFYWMESLTSIEGLEYLNTENVTTMESMFEGCTSLTSLDLTSLNTENVFTLHAMFEGCSGLTSLNLSSFNTSNVQVMWSMFKGCSSLTTLDLTNFDISNVEDVDEVFYNCSSLETIFCNIDWSSKSYTYSSEIFYNCVSLKGSNGTTYEDYDNDNSLSFAHPDGGPDNPGFFTPLSEGKIILYDSSTNTNTLSNNNNETVDVYFCERTLYKDGDWNTLCLPFSLTAQQLAASPLAGFSELRTLSNAQYEEGTLTLNFTLTTGDDAVTSIEAGKPYLIKWDQQSTDIVNPTFTGVTIQDVSESQMKVVTDYVDFVGNFNPITIGDAGDNTKLYLGASNGLYYPNGASTFYGFRAYFQLKNDITAGPGPSTGSSQVKAFRLNFGDEENGIFLMEDERSKMEDAYFTLDGRRLNDKPATAGLYINNGRKVMIK